MKSIPAVSMVLVSVTAAFGDSYIIPPDYRVACLDLKTGKLIWKTKPDQLARPTISAGSRVLVAESKVGTNPKTAKTVRYYLDSASGKLLKTKPKFMRGELVETLKPLPRNLKASDGTVFHYDHGNTRHLVSVKGTKQTVVKELESFPYDINIAGDLAIYTFGGGVSVRDTGGGDVYAYDLKKRKMAWKFQASSKLPKLSPASYTGIAIDGDRALVSVDQSIFALNVDTGKLLWTTRLPRQSIRRYDHPWTRIGRINDRLIVKCYDDLFVLRQSDGKLIWSFDCGAFGSPWPTINDDRVYVGTRN